MNIIQIRLFGVKTFAVLHKARGVPRASNHYIHDKVHPLPKYYQHAWKHENLTLSYSNSNSSQMLFLNKYSNRIWQSLVSHFSTK